ESAKEAQGDNCHRDPAADASLIEAPLELRRNLVKLRNGNHFARPRLQYRIIDLEQGLTGPALGFAFDIVNLVELRHHRTGESRADIGVGFEMLADETLIARIDDGAVRAPDPERYQPSSKGAEP